MKYYKLTIENYEGVCDLGIIPATKEYLDKTIEELFAWEDLKCWFLRYREIK